MAKRRMLSMEFVDQDRFVELPDRAKLLYIYFATHADDEGFVGSATKLMKIAGASKKMLELLVDEGFLIRFESGVYLVVDWLVHNTIRRDRSTRTLYLYERSLVGVNPMGQYYLLEECQPDDNQMTTECQPNDDQMTPQNRIDKKREEKNRKDKIIRDQIKAECVPFGREPADAGPEAGATHSGAQAPSMADIYEYCKAHSLNVDSALFYACYKGNGWTEDGKPLTDWKKTLRIWDQCNRNSA